jgi:hypothetical protein
MGKKRKGRKGSNLALVSLGPKYTPKGENATLMQQKAIAFEGSWPHFREHGLSGLEKPAGVRMNRAWKKVYKLYSKPSYSEKLKYARVLSDKGLDLLHCTEDDVRDALAEYIANETQAKKDNYIHKIASAVRGMFRCIGREVAYGNGKKYQSAGYPLLHSGNPMTTAAEQILVDDLVERVGDAATSPDHMVYPVSVVGGIMIMICHLSELMTMMYRWSQRQLNQASRMANLATLVLLYAFMLHEAGRPGELLNNLQHDHLYLPLHKKVYWLTLVMLRPDTLRYLLINDKLTHYAMSPFKGKTAQIMQPRLKAVIPHAYNSFDLVMIYIICVRCMLLVLKSEFNKLVFKHNANFSKYNGQRNEKLELKEFGYYAFRLAAAEEDKKFKIKDWWTRMRMGHTPTSTTKDKYARNSDNRVTAFGEELKLGCDIKTSPLSQSQNQITLEYVPLGASGCVYDTNWLSDTFDDAPISFYQDFVAADKLSDSFINGDCDASALIDYLKSQVPDTESWEDQGVGDYGFCDWISKLPLGFHYTFPSSMCASKLTSKFTEAKASLLSRFESAAQPRYVIEVYSFALTIYGNLRGLLGRSDKSTSKLVIESESENEQDPPPPSPVDDGNESDTSSDSRDSWTDGVDLSQIKKGNFVVIVCTDPSDKCALELPNMPGHWVFIGKVTNVGVLKVKKSRTTGKPGKAVDIRAKFMMNVTKDLAGLLEFKKGHTETIELRETSVIDVYSDKHLVGMRLTAENIEFIESFLQAHTR